MLVPFESLPNSARVWIYQSNRPFTEAEAKEVEQKVADFMQQWTAHGAELKGSFELKYRRFIVLAIDQQHASASGCSIDASVRFIQQLEKEYNVDLLDKMNVTYKTGEFIAHKPLLDFKKMAQSKSVSGKTIVFNNLVNTKEEYLDHWEVPASESWHSRFVK
ncbi:hypothetical protein GCM10009117_01410 [Gangjinia marincola]|uniref:ABC transporter ATPase n=1 Tax=Gangjinia marincola TaxID=578463 RepID=A0ABN1MD95_9FLAO